MPNCSAVNCSNGFSNGFKVHRFPTDKERRRKWFVNCRRDRWKLSGSSVLCDAHFEESQFELNRADGKRLLKKSAVPTIFDYTRKSKEVVSKRTNPTKKANRLNLEEGGKRTNRLNLEEGGKRTNQLNLEEGGKMNSNILCENNQPSKLSHRESCREDESYATTEATTCDNLTLSMDCAINKTVEPTSTSGSLLTSVCESHITESQIGHLVDILENNCIDQEVQSEMGSESDVIDSHVEMTFEWLCETGSTLCSDDWTCCCNEDYVCFGILEINDGQVYVRLSVSVSKIFQVKVFRNGQKAELPSISDTQIKTSDEIVALLDQVKRDDDDFSSVLIDPQENSADINIEESSEREFEEEEVKLEMSPTIRHELRLLSADEDISDSYAHQDFDHTFVKTKLNNSSDLIVSQELYENYLDIILNQPLVCVERLNLNPLSLNEILGNINDLTVFNDLEDDESRSDVEQYSFLDAAADMSSKIKTYSIVENVDYDSQNLSDATVDATCDVREKTLESEGSRKIFTHSGKTFYTKIEGRTPFKCKSCDKSYARMFHFNKHYRTRHMTKKSKF